MRRALRRGVRYALRMRAWPLMLSLVACSTAPPDGSTPDGAWVDENGNPIGVCPEGCPLNWVCGHDGFCNDPSGLHPVQVHWTVNKQSASDATCSNSPVLSVYFHEMFFVYPNTNVSRSFGYTPVACRDGVFAIPDLPEPAHFAYIEAEGEPTVSGPILNGLITLDLPY
jgi:hypothetical protein